MTGEELQKVIDESYPYWARMFAKKPDVDSSRAWYERAVTLAAAGQASFGLLALGFCLGFMNGRSHEFGQWIAAMKKQLEEKRHGQHEQTKRRGRRTRSGGGVE